MRPEQAAISQRHIDRTDSGASPGEVSNMSGRAYQALSAMIMNRQLRGGDSIIEQRLAERLGVSRTPLREAMQRLEGEGLLLKSAGRSYTVRKVDLSEYLQSLRVREVLESEACALAAGRIAPADLAEVRGMVEALERLEPYDTHAHWACDDRVHRMFIDACGNPVMARILYDLRNTTKLFEIDRLADRLGPDSREHLAIIDALRAGEAGAARAAMAAHARSLFDFAIAVIS